MKPGQMTASSASMMRPASSVEASPRIKASVSPETPTEARNQGLPGAIHHPPITQQNIEHSRPPKA